MPRKKKDSEELSIHELIHVVRGKRVILDVDLARIYGVPTKVLLQQVRRNPSKFPPDFLYNLTNQEVTNLKSQIVTSSWGGRRTNPIAFTEHGAIMAASVLQSEKAVAMSIFVVRAFVRMRELLAETQDLARKLDEVESKLSARLDGHEEMFEELFNDIRKLLSPQKSESKRIGFVIQT